MIPAESQRFMAARMNVTTTTHLVDHTPIVTAPDVVADVITEAVASTMM